MIKSGNNKVPEEREKGSAIVVLRYIMNQTLIINFTLYQIIIVFLPSWSVSSFSWYRFVPPGRNSTYDIIAYETLSKPIALFLKTHGCQCNPKVY